MTAIDLREFDVPGRGRGIIDLVKWRYLLRLLVQKGTATRYRNSALGWVWSYVKPASQFVVYYFVMGILLPTNRGVENFALYLFSGVVIINLFNEAFSNATTAIVDNSSLVKKIYLPRELFPVAAIIVGLIHFLPQVAVLLLICLIVGWIPTVAGIAAIFGGILLILALSLGLGLFFGAINVRFRDAQNLVEIIRMFATWTSPVLYAWPLVQNALPNWAFHIYMANPLTVAVELFHFGFWMPTTAENHGLAPHFLTYGLIAGIGCVLLLVVGQIMFRRFERTFAQDL